MFKRIACSAGYVGALAFMMVACTSTPVANNNEGATDSSRAFYGYESQVKYGEHVITIAGCGDCHTPKKMTPEGPAPDQDLAFSGHPSQMPPPDIDRRLVQAKNLAVTTTLTAWVGAWGISYAANITSDSTGIGNWKEDQFIYCLRNGKHKGLESARGILPPMPWQTTAQMTDEELKAIFAYLKSTRPVHNIVPEAQPPVGAPGK